jgi:hypothetical protein
MHPTCRNKYGYDVYSSMSLDNEAGPSQLVSSTYVLSTFIMRQCDRHRLISSFMTVVSIDSTAVEILPPKLLSQDTI